MKDRILSKSKGVCLTVCLVWLAVFLNGCEEGGYSTKPLYNDSVSTVYVKMFDNRSFERGVEFELTDALAKRIEAQTPYKVVSSMDRADSVISGYIGTAGRHALSTERQTGRPLEKDIVLTAMVNWKNLKTGEFLVEGKEVDASASWSEWQNQGVAYGSSLAANKLAERIVELMETPW
jgi:hypothetical protein